MTPYPKRRVRKHSKGVGDHADAWLMSYADLITLLFMFFAILVSASVSHHGKGKPSATAGEPQHPYVQPRAGTLALRTPYDDVYGKLTGIIAGSSADQSIGIEKLDNGLSIDISSVQFFMQGSANVPDEQLPLLKKLAQTLGSNILLHDTITVEGYTDDMPPKNSPFANNWELSAMRTARIAGLLAEAGVDAGRLSATSYASGHALVPNNDVEGKPISANHIRNQRVVIKVERKPLPAGHEQNFADTVQ